MITPAKILSKRYDATKTLLYDVSVSIFNTPSTKDSPVLTATCSTNSGTYEPYSVGDIVYIGFVNNSIEKPVILGTIAKAQDNSKSPSSYQYLNSLYVSNSVVLPENTKIGDITYENMSFMKRGIYGAVDDLKRLSEMSYSNFTICPDKDSVVGNYKDGNTPVEIHRVDIEATENLSTSYVTLETLSGASNILGIEGTYTYNGETYSIHDGILVYYDTTSKEVRAKLTSGTMNNVNILALITYK